MSAAENTVVCTNSRRHRIYSTRHYPVLGRYASSCTDLSSLDPKYSSKKIYSLQNILSQNFPRKKNQNAPIRSEIAYATLWDSGVDYLPPARWPIGSPRPERLPIPRGRYSIGPYLTTALDEVGCDVSLSWVGLGWVVLWFGWVRWSGGRRCR